MTENGPKAPQDADRISEDEVQALELDKYDYVRFSVTDINGVSRSKTVPKEHVRSFMKNGITVYTGAIGFGINLELPLLKELVESRFSNAFVRPMPGSFHSLPWDSNIKVGEFHCETFWIKPYRDGIPQAACPRFLARKQLERLSLLGYKLYSTSECEFCVFEKDQKTPIFPSEGMFASTLMDKYGGYLYDVERLLRQSGVDIQTLQTEYGAGQFEIVLKPKYGIDGPDQLVRLKDGVKAVSFKHNYVATFMTRPILSAMSSGMHYNHSLWSIESGVNAFHDPKDEEGLSAVARYWIAGLVKHARALAALQSPTVNCYRRLHSPFAPTKADWAIEDRRMAFRGKNFSPSETYFENRIPSSASNPYLVLAATVAAGLDGIQNRLECPAQSDTEALLLPKSLDEALECLKDDEVMVSAFGEEFIRWFTTIKRDYEINKTKDLAFDSKEAFDVEYETYFRHV